MDAHEDRLDELLNELAGLMSARNPGCAAVQVRARDAAGRALEVADVPVTASASAAPGAAPSAAS